MFLHDDNAFSISSTILLTILSEIFSRIILSCPEDRNEVLYSSLFIGMFLDNSKVLLFKMETSIKFKLRSNRIESVFLFWMFGHNKLILANVDTSIFAGLRLSFASKSK